MSRTIELIASTALAFTLSAADAIAAPPPPVSDIAVADDDETSGDDDDFDIINQELDLDFFKDDEEEDFIPTQRLQSNDELEPDSGDEQIIDELVPEPEPQEEINFLDDEEEEISINAPGQDNAQLYRDQMDSMKHLGPDEEIIAWERYLDRYPNSIFKDRIQSRIEELSTGLYDERVPQSTSFGGGAGAGHAELDFAAPVLLESIDPRDRLRASFEIGFPEYLNLMVDYEAQLMRYWSVHGGIRHRYTGWNIETGTHYSLIKSARTNTLLTLMGDVHFNTNPFYPSLRPQLAFGQRAMVGGNPLDMQLQAGVDLMFQSEFSLVYLAGGNLSYQASEKVRFFLETSLYMKHLGWEEGSSFRFNIISFGISFFVHKDMLATLGASAPYTTNYWGYHYGSIIGDYSYYL